MVCVVSSVVAMLGILGSMVRLPVLDPIAGMIVSAMYVRRAVCCAVLCCAVLCCSSPLSLAVVCLLFDRIVKTGLEIGMESVNDLLDRGVDQTLYTSIRSLLDKFVVPTLPPPPPPSPSSPFCCCVLCVALCCSQLCSFPSCFLLLFVPCFHLLPPTFICGHPPSHALCFCSLLAPVLTHPRAKARSAVTSSCVCGGWVHM
jgi:hypothetical protein